jgi:hypothetical protein
LQQLANRNDFFPAVTTYASGISYQGVVQLVGEIPAASGSTTAAIALMGPGELTKQ